MSAKPWYPWFPADWRAKTAGLSLLERGAYRELLDECYARSGRIPADPAALYRIAGAHSSAERAAVRTIVQDERFFAHHGEYLENNRAAQEIAYRNTKARAGKAGARSRWGYGTTDGKGDGTQYGETFARPNGTSHSKSLDESMAPQPQATNTLFPGDPVSPETPPGRLPQGGGKGRAKPKKPTVPPDSAPTWISYANAYLARYGTDPIRDAKANACITAFIRRVGLKEAPAIAAWYLSHPAQPYSISHHSLTLLVRDAYALRTQWKTGHQLTQNQARLLDRAASTSNAFAALIAASESTSTHANPAAPELEVTSQQAKVSNH